jgi:hypothetical protein
VAAAFNNVAEDARADNTVDTVPVFVALVGAAENGIDTEFNAILVEV